MANQELSKNEPFEVLGSENSQPENVFDGQSVLERVDGDWELLEQLVTLFLDSSPNLMAEIQDAIEHRDSSALHRAAHSLKGSVANLGGTAAQEAAMKLEQLGREGDMQDVDEAYLSLVEEVSQFKVKVVRFLQRG